MATTAQPAGAHGEAPASRSPKNAIVTDTAQKRLQLGNISVIISLKRKLASDSKGLNHQEGDPLRIVIKTETQRKCLRFLRASVKGGNSFI